MIQVELKTDDGTLYNILLPAPVPEDNLTPEAALEGAVEFVRQTIAQGQVFLNPDEALYIGATAKVRHIKAFFMTEGYHVDTDPGRDDSRSANSLYDLLTPVPFEEVVDYLGFTVQVEGVRCGYLEDPDKPISDHNGINYVFLPLRAANTPTGCLEFINNLFTEEGVTTVTRKAGINQGLTPDRIQIMPPPAPMNYAQAKEYVEDFLAELRKEQEEARELPPGRKTAKAFKEWKGLP